MHLFTICLLAICLVATGRHVAVDVKAEWNRYNSYTAEISEYISEESDDSFWQYVDTVCEHSSKIDSVLALLKKADSEKSGGEDDSEESAEGSSTLQTIAFEAATQVLPASLHKLMNTIIGLNSYAPAVQFFYSMSEPFGNPCNDNAFMVIYPGAHVVCHIEDILEVSNKMEKNMECLEDACKGEINDITSTIASKVTWDHVYPKTSNDEQGGDDVIKKVVLYGSVGTGSMCSLHKQLRSFASGTSIGKEVSKVLDGTSFSLRHAHVGQTLLNSQTRLQGYGVFLDIKNMEYKSYDDSKDKDGEEGKSEGDRDIVFDKDEEVAGVNFAKILERNPDIDKAELNAVREAVREEELTKAADASTMKLWKIKDLGVQTTAGIIEDKNPAQKFAEIVHNFPQQAAPVSTIKGSLLEKVRHGVDMWHNLGGSQMVPTGAVYINGIHVSLSGNTFNVYDTLSDLRKEFQQVNYLNRLNLPTHASHRLKYAALNIAAGKDAGVQEVDEGGDDEDEMGMMGMMGGRAKDDTIRVDVSRGARFVVSFYNNLERDKEYKHFPKSLKTLLQPTWSLHQLSRNLFTIICIGDALTEDGALLIYQFMSIVQQGYPLRIGVVPQCDSNSYVSTTLDRKLSDGATSEDVCRLFGAIKGKHGSKEAANFLFNVAHGVMESIQKKHMAAEMAEEKGQTAEIEDSNEKKTLKDMVETYVQTLSESVNSWKTAEYTADATQIVLNLYKAAETEDTNNNAYFNFSVNATSYVNARGLPMNSYSINGIIKTDVDIQSSLMQTLGKEQFLLSNWVRQGRIVEKTKSLFTAILDLTKAFPRYHPILQQSHRTIGYANFMDRAGRLLLEETTYHVSSYIEEGASSDDSVRCHRNTTLTFIPVSTAGLQVAYSTLLWARTLAVKNAYRVALHFLVSESQLKCFLADTSSQETGSCGAMDASEVSAFQVTSGITSLQKHYKQCNADITTAVFQLLEKVIVDKTSVDQALTDVFSSDGKGLPSDIQKEVKEAVLVGSSTFLRNMKLLRGISRHIADSEIIPQTADEAVVVYNSRIMNVPLYTDDSNSALNELDMVLLSNLEYTRMGKELDSILQQVYQDDEESGLQAVSDVFLFMTSFIGSYSASSSSHRVDVDAAFEGAGLKFTTDGIVVNSKIKNPHIDHGLEVIAEPLSFTVKAATDADSTTSADNENEEGNVSILYVVDPLSLAGQRAAVLLKLVNEQLGIAQTVFLVPKTEISRNEFPLQNFYRYVLSPHDVESAVAVYRNLPKQHTLTVRIDAPEPWNIQATTAAQDIDNLRCDSNTCGDEDTLTTSVGYTLRSILVAGQCFESVKKSSAFSYAPPAPPNGLQLTLTDASVNIGGKGENQTDALREHCSDTLVMQNLGYYQLQAQPGLYSLQLAEGRASELFTIDGATLSSDNGDNYEFSNTEKVSTSGAADGDNDESPIEDDNRGKVIAVKSFADVVHGITVTKRPGMEKVPLLEGGEDDDSRLAYRSGRRRTSAKKKKNKKKQDSSWSSGLSNLFGGGNNDAKGNGIVTETKKDDTIHVFSLATGHMYERLLRIMMLSVTKRTSAPVKFWLFENYLSPSFKAQAKAMAQEYNFEVAYVTYKWPEWLTQQTNKQRIIWGYKILFLDVLFPLNVDKVIYVDADQVLRADLKELWDLDLEGKPYAYTPFCDSRKETLGFQFWRQGYWNEHLRGRPYHISALYVVDLANFRRNAVGDQLRAVYDTLARDPNSLANLDQDLPNYAQHSVPIHSLPQEWLWCESWCSDESKAKAKTIDLCNNPLHKEPKLDMARRVVSGSLFNESWIELDDEIRRLQIREGFQLDS